MMCLFADRIALQASPASDTVDVLHYRIHIRQINFVQKSIHASARLNLVTKLPTTVIPLELKQLSVDSVRLNGSQSSFSHTGERLAIEAGFQAQPSDTLTIDIHYHGVPFSEQWGGFHFSGNYAFNLGVGFVSIPHNLGKAWFPCIDDFTDRASYEVLATVPAGMKASSGGALYSVTSHPDGSSTWHWHLQKPIPTYLASVAIGAYAFHQWEYQGMNGIIPVTIFSRPQDSLKVAGTFQTLGQIMDSFESRYGPYPFDRIGYTSTAIGAMEHVENIALPHSSFSGNLNNEYLIAHELSHMWFGNSTTCASAGEMWLNEGWATFCHHFYKHDLYSPQLYRTEMNNTHYEVLRNAHLSDGGYWALNNVPEQYTYGNTSYDKGATVIHTLMNYMGQDKFFPAVRAYLDAFRFSHASSYDLRNALSAHSGINLNDFFEAWVFTPGTPHFWYDSLRVTQEGALFKTEVYLRQKYKGVDFLANSNILELTFVGPQWQMHTDTVHFSGRTGHSVKFLPFEPVVVFPDYYDKTADATTDVSGVIRAPGTFNFSKLSFTLYADAVPDSSLYRITHHWVAPDSLKSPIPGLRLSPYRHWEISGIFRPGTQLRGRFFYSNAANLDAGLIRSAADSVVILYRPSPAHDWQAIPHTRTGLWSIGYLNVDNLQPGQYTLAAWDTQLVGLDKNLDIRSLQLKVKPNPANDSLSLNWGRSLNGTLTINDMSGKILSEMVLLGQASVVLNVQSWPSGAYFATIMDESGKTTGSIKFIRQ
ncbi:MAG: T9SS type A sorting domain-containing protein [Bacteroidetes bacterium]|nr:T9SS type A sorting domain-containing protein [Bacteroidota bacterium]